MVLRNGPRPPFVTCPSECSAIAPRGHRMTNIKETPPSTPRPPTLENARSRKGQAVWRLSWRCDPFRLPELARFKFRRHGCLTHLHCWRNRRDLAGQRLHLHGPVVDPHTVPRVVRPRQRVLHPGIVAALREIFPRVRAPALL